MTDDTDQDTGDEPAEDTQDAAEAAGEGEAGEGAAAGDESDADEDDADDQNSGGDEDGGNGGGGNGGGGSEDERLAKLGEQIDQARTKARETIGEPEEKFYESGDAEAEQEDDQTIAPPG